MGNILVWSNMAPTLKNFNILFYQTNYRSWIVSTRMLATWGASVTVLTAVIFASTLSMQGFLYGLAFVSPGDQKPVPVGVPTELISGDVYCWGSLMGAALLVGLPVAILYNSFLDRFIQWITGGVMK